MPGSGSGAQPGAGLRVFFMGTPALAVPTLAALADTESLVGVASQPDRRAGRGRQPLVSPVKAWALEHGIPLEQPATLRAPEVVTAIRSYRADVIVVLAYGLILPAEILEMPRLGCINVHGSLLPRHRGASPIQAAILAGDRVSGVTTMLMNEGLDTGPILLRAELSLRPDDTAESVGQRLASAGASLAVETLHGLAAGHLTARQQDESAATMTRLLSKSDGRIDWTQSAVEIDRRVRAMQPWPVAFGDLGGRRLQIWQVDPGPENALQDGEAMADVDGLLVGCGDGESLRILELQRAGGRRMLAAEFLRGFALASGARFTSDAPR